MPTAFIFHGTGSKPTENWFPWLAQALEADGYTVIVPQFPTPENQSAQTWLATMEIYQNDIGADTIFIGHSIGATFALHLLEHYSIKARFFVAGFIDSLNNPQFDPLIKTFVEYNFDWATIRSHSKSFSVFHSDNDPYVPIELAEHLATKLQTDLTLIPQGGHLNATTGYREFPLLLERIQQLN